MYNINKYFKNIGVDGLLDPLPMINRISELLKTIKFPSDAKQALADVSKELTSYKADDELIVQIGMLMEKTREPNKLFDVWFQIFQKFPYNPVAARMCMRWFYRMRDVDYGFQVLRQATPNYTKDIRQAEVAFFGYSELKMDAEIKDLMFEIFDAFPNDIKIRSRYVQFLDKQGAYGEALEVVNDAGENVKWGPSLKKLISELHVKKLLPQANKTQSKEAIGDIAALYENRQRKRVNTSGRICFFTGQLGAGGAERQMTRIAVLMQKRFEMEQQLKGKASQLKLPPMVCVKHANSHSKSDFFLPVLEEASVQTEILNNLDEVSAHDIIKDEKVLSLLELVPKDLRVNILKLAYVFKKEKVDVAYLWQDGGVLIGAVAALIAEVSDIYLNFRGMPPVLRPELMRNEMPHLYRQLCKVPGIHYTSNSGIAAKSYCEWLELDQSRFTVIPNAVPKQSLDGFDEDKKAWSNIKKRSLMRTKTVLGVYRFDDNKRPTYWIEMANEYSKNNPNTRFVIVGQGKMMSKCQELILELQAENRIFLIGTSKSVGFWYDKADLVMHLARMEGLPNVLIESQISGCPVLSTPAGGVPEVVLHGQTGYILNCAQNPCSNEIQAALKDLLSNEAKLKEQGQEAMRIMSPRHNMDNILQITLDMLCNKDNELLL